MTVASIAGCTATLGDETQQQTAEVSQPAAPTAETSIAIVAPAENTDARVAWDALMGVDGEYAAAALYQAVIDTFGDVEPYVTIKASEDRHIEALKRQLERLDVEIPDNPYSETAVAPADLQDAAEAWAEGEVANVDMYDELLTQTDDPRLTNVLGNLQRASLESHLPLFEAAAENDGTLSDEQMTEVRESQHEGDPEARATKRQSRNGGPAGQPHRERPTRGQHFPDL